MNVSYFPLHVSLIIVIYITNLNKFNLQIELIIVSYFLLNVQNSTNMYRTVQTCTEHCTYVHNTVHKYLSQLYNCCNLNLQIDWSFIKERPYLAIAVIQKKTDL